MFASVGFSDGRTPDKKFNVLRGNLFKKEKLLFSESWNLFYFKLEGDKFCCYRDETCEEQVCYYNLSSKGVTVHPITHSDTTPNPQIKHSKFEFQLTIPKITREKQEGVSVTFATTKYSQLWSWVDGLLQWINAFKRAKQSYQTRHSCAKFFTSVDFDLELYTGSSRLQSHKELEKLIPVINPPPASPKGNVKLRKMEDNQINSLDEAVKELDLLRNELNVEREKVETLSSKNGELESKNEELESKNVELESKNIALMNELEQLRKRYFFSIASAMRLERKLSRINSKNINIQTLWEEIENSKLSFNEWPEWISGKLNLNT